VSTVYNCSLSTLRRAPRGGWNNDFGRLLRVFRKRRRMQVIRNSNWLQYVSLCSHVTYACNGNFIQCLQRSHIPTYTNQDTCSVCICLCQDIFAYILLRNNHSRKFAHACNVCAHSYVREYVRWCVCVHACVWAHVCVRICVCISVRYYNKAPWHKRYALSVRSWVVMCDGSFQYIIGRSKVEKPLR